ncbi:MAG TPA: FAD-dependent oxidoreductase, partial [Verrucomicrobiota bacterium]|nr:FAD-dependent oxidoreductase [Verrucomicrobiota bacterium]
PPYPIDYGAIVPRKAQCSNLLVPVCLSASHMAFGSIRMEPVFMALGQSAATAAVQSIEAKSSVQDIDYNELRSRLLKDRQVLAWTTP